MSRSFVGIAGDILARLGGRQVKLEKARPVLKQAYDITAADFAQHPVWVGVHTLDYNEPWHDDTDEATYRPWTGPLPIKDDVAFAWVRAHLTLADGTAMAGTLQIAPAPQADSSFAEMFRKSQASWRPNDREIARVQPGIFLPDHALIDFWQGGVPRLENRPRLYEALGRSPDQLFPIRYQSEEGLITPEFAGEIEGFYALVDFEHVVVEQ